jgi:hypothetical protein
MACYEYMYDITTARQQWGYNKQVRQDGNGTGIGTGLRYHLDICVIFLVDGLRSRLNFRLHSKDTKETVLCLLTQLLLREQEEGLTGSLITP